MNKEQTAACDKAFEEWRDTDPRRFSSIEEGMRHAFKCAFQIQESRLKVAREALKAIENIEDTGGRSTAFRISEIVSAALKELGER